MHRLLSAVLACLLLLAAVVPAASAQEPTPFGQVITVLPVQATKLLTDHVRLWVYAATSDNTITIIDTTTLAVVDVIPLDFKPGFMALSENGALLYVADPTAADRLTIAVLDMNLLQVVRTIHPVTFSSGISGFVAGRDDRLYVAVGYAGSGLYQIDGTTGEIQATIASTNPFDTAYRTIEINPDRSTIYVSEYKRYPGGYNSLNLYDVSGPDAQHSSQGFSGLQAPYATTVASHDGRYLLKTKFIDNVDNSLHDAAIVLATDISQRVSVFDRDGIVDGPPTFSLDGSVVCQVFNPAAVGPSSPLDGNTAPYTQIEMWRTADGARLGQTALVYPDGGKHAFGNLTVDASGAYLLATQQDDSDPANPVGVVTVLGTGFAPVQPPPPPPAPPGPKVSVTTLVSSTAFGQPPGKWQFSRTGKDVSAPLTVTYTLDGTARNGRDYNRRSGSATFPANSRHVKVTVVPKGDFDGQPSKTAHIALSPGDDYRLGKAVDGVITITAPANK